MNISHVILTVFVMATVILSVTAISCYQCNSKDDPECTSLDAHLPHKVAGFFLPCVGNYNGSMPFCRKTDLTVEEGDLRRTIRSCGWIKTNEKTYCYKADNDDHLETVCQCFDDGCNTATGVSKFGAAVTVMATILVASLF